MGRRKVNYGASVGITAAAMQKAINDLRNIQIDQVNMFTAVMSPVIFKHLSNWTVSVQGEDRPDWIRKLEKEWGIR